MSSRFNYTMRRGCYGYIPHRVDKANMVFKPSKKTNQTPLFTIVQGLYNGANDMFGIGNTFTHNYTIKYSSNFESLFNVYNVKKMRNYAFQFTNKQLAISLFSVLGQTQEALAIPSGIMLNSHDNRNSLINLNGIDVICLAVMKTSDIANSVEINDRNINFNLRKVKVLMSQQKFKNVDYMPQHYNKGIRAALVREYNILAREKGLTLEVVDDEVLKQYYNTQYHLNIKSLSEATQVVEQIKDVAFEKIFDHLTV